MHAYVGQPLLCDLNYSTGRKACFGSIRYEPHRILKVAVSVWKDLSRFDCILSSVGTRYLACRHGTGYQDVAIIGKSCAECPLSKSKSTHDTPRKHPTGFLMQWCVHPLVYE
jgi:hypothetical protein